MNPTTRNPLVLQVSNLIAVIAVIVVNGLATTLPLNGRTTEMISDELPSYFTPAGYTFSVWGLIYAALIGFAIYQLLPSQRERPFIGRIGWLFVLSSVANIAWIFSWHYAAYLLSLIFMVSLALVLAAIYLRLNIGRPDPALTTADKLLYQAPFSLYLAWITVAAIANFASVLGPGYLDWNAFGIPGPVWSAIMMGVAVVVAGLVLFNRRNLAYAGVLVWALLGIRAAHADVAIVATTAVIAAVLIIALALLGYWRTGAWKRGSRAGA